MSCRNKGRIPFFQEITESLSQLTAILLLTVIILGASDLWNQASASGPVPATYEGCVVSHNFYFVRQGKDQFPKKTITNNQLKIRDRDGKPFNLTPFEGKKIRISGKLLPGDRFFIDPGSIKVLGPCPKPWLDYISN